MSFPRTLVKHNQPCPGFEHGSTILFPITMTITLSVLLEYPEQKQTAISYCNHS